MKTQAELELEVKVLTDRVDHLENVVATLASWLSLQLGHQAADKIVDMTREKKPYSF